MEICAPFVFLGNWALVVPYLCSKFHIFNRLFWKNMFFRSRGPTPFQSCFHAIQYIFPPIAKEMYLYFESLTIINTPS